MSRSTQRSELPSAVRSLEVGFTWHAGEVWWGATWACLCGALAALPWAPLEGSARFAVSWFSTVVLLGAVWAPATGSVGAGGRTTLPGGTEPTLVRTLGAWAPGLMRRLAAGSRGWRPLRTATLQRVVSAVMALTLAWMLGAGPAAVMAVGLVLALALPGSLWRATWPLRRTALEIVVPAATAWLALGGPEPVPASASVFGGAGQSAGMWLSANWGFMAVLAAFAVVYHAATSVHRPADLPGRHRELVIGYGAAVLALAVLDRPLAAGAVAALFIGQWPFQAEFRAGRVRWHLNLTQPVAMAAMLVAAVGAG